MSYTRVIPRDLFNEANLLKCLGQLYLLAEKHPDLNASIEHCTDECDAFEICQDPNDGTTYVANINIVINGVPLHVFRPLNSRDPWPLYATAAGLFGGGPVEVFTEDGQSFSAGFLNLVTWRVSSMETVNRGDPTSDRFFGTVETAARRMNVRCTKTGDWLEGRGGSWWTATDPVMAALCRHFGI